MEERKSRRSLKVVALALALGLAMVWGMVVGGGLVYAWTHFFEGGRDRAGAKVITLDLPAETLQRRALELGALVVEVVPGTPAEQAGLQAGDRIVAVDGTRIGLDRDLAEVLAEHPEIRGRAYLGVRYAPTSGWMPDLPTVPFGELEDGLRFDRPKGEFRFYWIPGREESY
jgi:membrane-associated protease RseP (regulator of RpoE activity)